MSAPLHKEQLPVAILAGGLATRLFSIASGLPKSLVPIGNKPFLAYQLDLLRSQGIRRVVLCVGHLGEKIRDAFGDGSQWELALDYSSDGNRLLGTGGALRNALPLLGPSFFVLYGDSYLPIDLGPVQDNFRVSGKSALMTVYENCGRWDRSNVKFAQGRIEVYDKRNSTHDMKHIDYGLSILSSSVVNEIPSGEPYDLADLFSNLARKGRLAGYEIHERFYEIGSPQGLKDFEEWVRFQQRNPP